MPETAYFAGGAVVPGVPEEPPPPPHAAKTNAAELSKAKAMLHLLKFFMFALSMPDYCASGCTFTCPVLSDTQLILFDATTSLPDKQQSILELFQVAKFNSFSEPGMR